VVALLDHVAVRGALAHEPLAGREDAVGLAVAVRRGGSRQADDRPRDQGGDPGDSADDALADYLAISAHEGERNRRHSGPRPEQQTRCPEVKHRSG